MPGKSHPLSFDLLKLIFNGTGIANLADNAASAPAGTLYLALHTADPGDTGPQTTSEVAYTGYARVGVARTTAGWTVTAAAGGVLANAKLAADTDFPSAPAGATGTATHWSVGMATTGTGRILYSGPIAPTIALGEGVIPRLRNGTTITED